MRKQIVLLGALILFVLAGSGAITPGPTQTEPLATATPTPAISPPPPPTLPAAPNVSGTWAITRTWFRRCPRCSEPVIRGTTWEIIQNGHELRIDKGLRGTIEGYNIRLEGIESDGFNRFDFYYSRLYLSPDGLVITGEFVGSETLQNPCLPTPPIVTCFAHGGYFYAIRRSPATTFPPPPTPGPIASETPTPTASVTVTLVLTPTPSTTLPGPSATPFPTEPTARPATISHYYLSLLIRLASPVTATTTLAKVVHGLGNSTTPGW